MNPLVWCFLHISLLLLLLLLLLGFANAAEHSCVGQSLLNIDNPTGNVTIILDYTNPCNVTIAPSQPPPAFATVGSITIITTATTPVNDTVRNSFISISRVSCVRAIDETATLRDVPCIRIVPRLHNSTLIIDSVNMTTSRDERIYPPSSSAAPTTTATANISYYNSSDVLVLLERTVELSKLLISRVQLISRTVAVPLPSSSASSSAHYHRTHVARVIHVQDGIFQSPCATVIVNCALAFNFTSLGAGDNASSSTTADAHILHTATGTVAGNVTLRGNSFTVEGCRQLQLVPNSSSFSSSSSSMGTMRCTLYAVSLVSSMQGNAVGGLNPFVLANGVMTVAGVGGPISAEVGYIRFGTLVWLVLSDFIVSSSNLTVSQFAVTRHPGVSPLSATVVQLVSITFASFSGGIGGLSGVFDFQQLNVDVSIPDDTNLVWIPAVRMISVLELSSTRADGSERLVLEDCRVHVDIVRSETAALLLPVADSPAPVNSRLNTVYTTLLDVTKSSVGKSLDVADCHLVVKAPQLNISDVPPTSAASPRIQVAIAAFGGNFNSTARVTFHNNSMDIALDNSGAAVVSGVLNPKVEAFVAVMMFTADRKSVSDITGSDGLAFVNNSMVLNITEMMQSVVALLVTRLTIARINHQLRVWSNVVNFTSTVRRDTTRNVASFDHVVTLMWVYVQDYKFHCMSFVGIVDIRHNSIVADAVHEFASGQDSSRMTRGARMLRTSVVECDYIHVANNVSSLILHDTHIVAASSNNQSLTCFVVYLHLTSVGNASITDCSVTLSPTMRLPRPTPLEMINSVMVVQGDHNGLGMLHVRNCSVLVQDVLFDLVNSAVGAHSDLVHMHNARNVALVLVEDTRITFRRCIVSSGSLQGNIVSLVNFRGISGSTTQGSVIQVVRCSVVLQNSTAADAVIGTLVRCGVWDDGWTARDPSYSIGCHMLGSQSRLVIQDSCIRVTGPPDRFLVDHIRRRNKPDVDGDGRVVLPTRMLIVSGLEAAGRVDGIVVLSNVSVHIDAATVADSSTWTVRQFAHVTIASLRTRMVDRSYDSLGFPTVVITDSHLSVDSLVTSNTTSLDPVNCLFTVLDYQFANQNQQVHATTVTITRSTFKPPLIASSLVAPAGGSTKKDGSSSTAIINIRGAPAAALRANFIVSESEAAAGTVVSPPSLDALLNFSDAQQASLARSPMSFQFRGVVAAALDFIASPHALSPEYLAATSLQLHCCHLAPQSIGLQLQNAINMARGLDLVFIASFSRNCTATRSLSHEPTATAASRTVTLTHSNSQLQTPSRDSASFSHSASSSNSIFKPPHKSDSASLTQSMTVTRPRNPTRTGTTLVESSQSSTTTTTTATNVSSTTSTTLPSSSTSAATNTTTATSVSNTTTSATFTSDPPSTTTVATSSSTTATTVADTSSATSISSSSNTTPNTTTTTTAYSFQTSTTTTTTTAFPNATENTTTAARLIIENRRYAAPSSALARSSEASRGAAALVATLVGGSPAMVGALSRTASMGRIASACLSELPGSGTTTNGTSSSSSSSSSGDDNGEEELVIVVEPLDVLNSPLQLAIGPDSYIARYWLGALAGNIAVCFAWSFVLFCCAYAHKLHSARKASIAAGKGEGDNTVAAAMTWKEVLVEWAYPARWMVVFLFLVPGTCESIAAVAAYGLSSNSDSSNNNKNSVASSLSVSLIVAAVLFILVPCVRHIQVAIVGLRGVEIVPRNPPPRGFNRTPTWRKFFWTFVEGEQMWTESDFTKSYLMFVDPLRMPWFLVVDFSASVVTGVCGGVASFLPPGGCTADAIAALIALAAHTAFLAYGFLCAGSKGPPFFGTVDRVFVTLLSVLGTAFGAVCVAIVASVGSGSQSDEASSLIDVMESLAAAQAAVGAILGVFQLMSFIVELWDNCLDHDAWVAARKREASAFADDTGNDGDDDDQEHQRERTRAAGRRASPAILVNTDVDVELEVPQQQRQQSRRRSGSRQRNPSSSSAFRPPLSPRSPARRSGIDDLLEKLNPQLSAMEATLNDSSNNGDAVGHDDGDGGDLSLLLSSSRQRRNSSNAVAGSSTARLSKSRTISRILLDNI